jgi:hypothetical protein
MSMSILQAAAEEYKRARAAVKAELDRVNGVMEQVRQATALKASPTKWVQTTTSFNFKTGFFFLLSRHNPVPSESHMQSLLFKHDRK